MAKVQVEQGYLEGEVLDLVTGDGTYYSFKGIPYAQPPVGKLRFKAPQPALPWEGVRKATQHGPICPQFDIFTNKYIEGNEDCLYLNVYTPDIKPKQPLPVMIFIHGGGFKSGCGDVDEYGPDFLIQQGVVLVTINYRLEVLGFLCLDTIEVPGNAGLKDQNAAIKWVKQNISNFGGDSNNITVFGESAGGSSTALHVISPMSKGIFHRAIPMSGVPLCDWSRHFEPRRRAFVLGKQLGIMTDDPNVLLEELQKVPVDKLRNTNPCVIAQELATNTIAKMFHFTPVVEKQLGQEAFLIEDPEESLKKGRINNVDIMIGFTNQETLILLKYFKDVLPAYQQYREMLVPRELLIKCKPDTLLKIGDKIYKHYFGDKFLSDKVVREFVTYMNEVTFVYNINRYSKFIPKIGNAKRYFYRFSCESERNLDGIAGHQYGIHGASHLDDLKYLFDPKIYSIPIDKNGVGYKMIVQTCKLFTNFAKYGNPTPDGSFGVIWPEYDNVNQMLLDISETLTPIKNPYIESINFWQSIYDEVNA